MTLIFGVVKIVNFAPGEFVMIGMYITFFLFNSFGIDPLLSLFVSTPVLFVVGALVQHLLIRRVLGPNDMPQIFLTFAPVAAQPRAFAVLRRTTARSTPSTRTRPFTSPVSISRSQS